MPLYLVRWPALHTSLVRARDEDELLDTLDQVADPGGCTYKVYKGPVWIDFALPFTIRDITPEKKVPTEPSDFTVDPSPEFDNVEGTLLRPEVPCAETAEEMVNKIMRFAFPSLFEYLDERMEADVCGAKHPDAGERYPEGLRAALVADLMPLVRDCQASAALQERDDLEAQMMKQARVTVMLPFMRRALERAVKAAPGRKAD